MTDHPITPPPELVEQWYQDGPEDDERGLVEYAATQAARWGADQELEECCEWLGREVGSGWGLGAQLRDARRPKPPSLKERALQAWTAVEEGTDDQTAMAVIRRALEQLDD